MKKNQDFLARLGILNPCTVRAISKIDHIGERVGQGHAVHSWRFRNVRPSVTLYILLLRLLGRLVLAGLSWDRVTRHDDQFGGITLSLRCWFRPATSRDFFRRAFSHSSFLGFRLCRFQGFHRGVYPSLGDQYSIFEIVQEIFYSHASIMPEP